MSDDVLDEVLNEVEASASRARLGELLALASVGRQITRVRVYGRGGKAHVRLDLDNGERIVLDPLGSYSSPAKMNFEIASQAGCKPTLKAGDLQEVVTLLYWLGEHYDASETADRAWELGAEYLRGAVLCDVDMGDQASRWRAFCLLDAKDTKHNTVLLDTTGSRYVRTQWFMEHLRGRSDVGESAALRAELERGGWKKPGTEGRVKATDPQFPRRTLQWAFLIVPDEWEDQ